MSDWTKFRDTAEAAAVLVGNYYFPGSSMVTKKLVSDGAEEKLDSDTGRVLQLGSGGFGVADGNLANWVGGGEGGMNLPFQDKPVSGIDLGGPGSGPGWENSLQSGIDIGGPGSSPANTGDSVLMRQVKQTYGQFSDAKSAYDIGKSMSQNRQSQQGDSAGVDAPQSMDINSGNQSNNNDARRQALMEKASELRQKIAELRAQIAREQSLQRSTGTPE